MKGLDKGCICSASCAEDKDIFGKSVVQKKEEINGIHTDTSNVCNKVTRLAGAKIKCSFEHSNESADFKTK